MTPACFLLSNNLIVMSMSRRNFFVKTKNKIERRGQSHLKALNYMYFLQFFWGVISKKLHPDMLHNLIHDCSKKWGSTSLFLHYIYLKQKVGCFKQVLFFIIRHSILYIIMAVFFPMSNKHIAAELASLMSIVVVVVVVLFKNSSAYNKHWVVLERCGMH